MSKTFINCSVIFIKISLTIFILLLGRNVFGLENNNNDNNNSNITNNGKFPIDLNQFGKENFMIGISQIGIRENLFYDSNSNNNNNSSKCAEELQIFLNSVENSKVWALKIIDAFGKAPKSFIWGNYFWFSSRELCNDINDPFRISLSDSVPKPKYNHGIMNETSPFPVRFQVVYFNFSSPMTLYIKPPYEHLIHVGLCIPDSCTLNEIVHYAREYFGNEIFETQKIFDIKMDEVGTKVPGFQWSYLFRTGVQIFFFTLCIILTFCILAEVITRLHTRSTDLRKSGSLESNTGWESFVLCFSLRENFPRIMKADDPKNIMPVIAGLRTFVCIWVTVFHVYYYSLYTINNVPMVFAKLENIALQPVVQSCFYVDIFFVISGFLLSYNFLSKTSVMQIIRTNRFIDNVILFLKYVLHRYCRLMPVFYIIMVVSDAMYDFIDLYSPFKVDKGSGIYCKETWWYNFLFINNFLDLKYICSSWSWYLGCEMQFFIFFLLLLFIFTKYETFGKVTFLISALIFGGISFCLNYYYGITFQSEVVKNTIEQLYVKPWMRINPYFGGVFMGWMYYKTKSSGISISNLIVHLFWIVTSIIYLVTIYMTYWNSTPIWLVSLIMSFGKLLFGFLIGTVIFLCQHGYGGVFNNLMGCKLFLHLNKFSFSVYMMAPIIVASLFGLRTESTLFNEVASTSDLITVIVVSYALAFIVILLVEMPFNRISNRFILRKM